MRKVIPDITGGRGHPGREVTPLGLGLTWGHHHSLTELTIFSCLLVFYFYYVRKEGMFKLHLLPSRKKLSVHVSPLFELMLICEGLRNVRRLAKSQKLRKDLIWHFEQHWEFNI